MKIVVIQINNNKVYKLLEDLEELHLIKILGKEPQPHQKLSERYKGVFTEQDAKNFNEHTRSSRKD